MLAPQDAHQSSPCECIIPRSDKDNLISIGNILTRETTKKDVRVDRVAFYLSDDISNAPR